MTTSAVTTVRKFSRWLCAGLALAAVGCLTLVPRPAVAAAPSNGAAAIVGKTTVAAIDAYVRQQAAADHVPGTAVGIVDGGRPVLLSGFGNATAATSFYLGSLSKSFTALAVMQLAARGQVNLDAPVRTYIPWFAIGDGRQSAAVTVRQLLDQTSGISTKAGQSELSFSPATTFPEAIKGFETFPLTAAPGTRFQYSDANYTIAGYIVALVSGQSYDSYLRQHIFTPLGMTHTYAMTGTARGPGRTPGYATWLGLPVPLTDQVAAPLVPAGYIMSSAADMTRYLTAEMNGGVFHGTRIAPASAVRETQAALVPLGGQSPVPGATAYGLGWGVGTVNGSPVIVHDGQLRDFDSAAAILPAQQVAVIVLMNADPQLAVNDDQLYNGIVQGITTGTFPPVSHSFLTFYAVFDAIAAATVIAMAWSLARTGRWRRKVRARAVRSGVRWLAARAAGLDLATAAAIAAGVAFGLGAVTGNEPLTPTLMMFTAPDVAVWIYTVVLFFVLRAVVRVVAIGVPAAGRRPGPGAIPRAETVASPIPPGRPSA